MKTFFSHGIEIRFEKNGGKGTKFPSFRQYNVIHPVQSRPGVNVIGWFKTKKEAIKAARNFTKGGSK